MTSKFHRSPGCAAKLSGERLRELLSTTRNDFPTVFPSDPLIFEDAASITSGVSNLLVSVDLGPPVFQSSFDSGRIAALNSLSDIYARGGTARWLLPIIAARESDDENEGPDQYLRGMAATCQVEGVQILGGHTTVSTEVLIGATSLGTALSPLSKHGALPGDKLLLSKPLVNSLVLPAFAAQLVSTAVFSDVASVMLNSNAKASKVAVAAGVAAATDVTGFGLLGHLTEMLGPTLGVDLDICSVPTVPQLLPPEISGILDSSRHRANLGYATANRLLETRAPFAQLIPLLDPQTNGGLLVAARDDAAYRLVTDGFTIIGTVVETPVLRVSI